MKLGRGDYPAPQRIGKDGREKERDDERRDAGDSDEQAIRMIDRAMEV